MIKYPLILLAVVVTANAEPALPVPSIERLDPVLDSLIAPGTPVEILAEGFRWSEGPVWKDGRLLFSDVPACTIFSWKEGDKTAEVFLKPSGSDRIDGQGSNGLAVDAANRLVLCRHGDRNLGRMEPDGTLTILAKQFEGKRFNSPNDLTITKSGDILFTDPAYGLGKNVPPELPFRGVFRLSPDGRLTLLTSELKDPNGIALSPDEKVLYIAVSDPADSRIMAYDLEKDGSLSNGRVFFSIAGLPKRPGICDGLKVDTGGNVWAAGPGGIYVINQEGKLLGAILTGTPTANCGWGGPARDTLYITADHRLLRVKTLSKGL